MKFNLSKIEITKNNISLPEKLTDELSEETGLHLGDGTMNFYLNRGKLRGSYALRGHITDDKPHYNSVVSKLYKEIYDLNVRL